MPSFTIHFGDGNGVKVSNKHTYNGTFYSVQRDSTYLELTYDGVVKYLELLASELHNELSHPSIQISSDMALEQKHVRSDDMHSNFQNYVELLSFSVNSYVLQAPA